MQFKLPDIGEGLAEGEVTKWLVQEGDAVRENEPMVEVLTDKAAIEISAPVQGRIVKILVAEGKMAKIGEVLVEIEEGSALSAPAAPKLKSSSLSDESLPVSRQDEDRGEEEERVEPISIFNPPRSSEGSRVKEIADYFRAKEKPRGTVETISPREKVLSTPATRRYARGQKVDIRLVPGSGPRGRVTREDIDVYVESRSREVEESGSRGAQVPSAVGRRGVEESRSPGVQESGSPEVISQKPGAGRLTTNNQQRATVPVVSDPTERIEPIRGIVRKMYERMSLASQRMAGFTFVEEAVVSALVQLRLRSREKAQEQGIKLTYLPYIIKALIPAFKQFPRTNAWLDEEKQELHICQDYNIGIAVATQNGLIVPVVKQVDRKNILTLAREIDELSTQAREGKLTSEEMSGGTFTITSLGAQGGLLATPIMNYPQVCILGVHKIREVPLVKDGQITIGHVMNFSITSDHRVVDGFTAASLLQSMIRYLEDPDLLLLEVL